MSSIFGIGNGWYDTFQQEVEFPEISDSSYFSVFLRNCKWWTHGSPFRGILFFKDSNVHQSYNFLPLLQFLFHWSRNSVSTRMNRFTIRIHQLETNWFNIQCWILLMFHQTDVHIFGVIFSVDAVPLHGDFHMSWWHHLSLLAFTQHLEFW
jgi:hypothetical protein